MVFESKKMVLESKKMVLPKDAKSFSKQQQGGRADCELDNCARSGCPHPDLYTTVTIISQPVSLSFKLQQLATTIQMLQKIKTALPTPFSKQEQGGHAGCASDSCARSYMFQVTFDIILTFTIIPFSLILLLCDFIS